jgi:multicomponent Na+:H+ antiporter subunit E
MTARMTKAKRQKKLSRTQAVRWFVAYVAIWSLLWWLISEGDAASWLVGFPTVLAAAGVSLWLAPTSVWRWQIRGVVPFAWYFGRASLDGGFDVAWRALHPHLPIEPGLIEYRTRLPEGTARVFFANAISLCPGTVSASMRGDRLTIHVLDLRHEVVARLGDLEQKVAVLFGAVLLPEDHLTRRAL